MDVFVLNISSLLKTMMRGPIVCLLRLGKCLRKNIQRFMNINISVFWTANLLPRRRIQGIPGDFLEVIWAGITV